MKSVISFEIKEENGYLVAHMPNESIVKGSSRMAAVGGGIKARVSKTKDGSTVVETYLFDKDRFSKETAEKWLVKNKSHIDESMKKVQENAPSGSFQDITMRLQSALNNISFFSDASEYPTRPYVCYVFPEYCIATISDEYWKIPYTDAGANITIGTPVKVEMNFVVKEAAILNEKLNRLAKPNTQISNEFAKLKIQEGSYDEKAKTFSAVLIEAGVNYSKARYYPQSTIQEAAPLFAGLKMFANHPTDHEEKTRPERDIKDWVATILESWYEDGKAVGKIHVHDKNLLENMQDAVYREHIGLSINASGRRYSKVIDGIQMEVIEKIVAPRSVDFVTEPGARGRVEDITESKGEEEMEITVQTLRENHAEVVKQIETAVIAPLTEKKDAEIKALTERAEKAENELKAIKEAEVKKSWAEKIGKILSESKLAKKSCERIQESIVFDATITDADLEKTVKEAIAKEREYLKEVGGIRIGVDGGDKTELVESLSKSLEKAVGIVEDEKK